jgi:excisionase family DNA binding protein
VNQTIDLDGRYITSKQAANLLGVTTRTIQLWSESGVLKAWKTPGGHRRFNVAEIEGLKAQFKKEAKAPEEQRLIRILVIEGDYDLIRLYTMTIEGWNLPVILATATDGFEGLIQIGAWKPDIVITDIKMPNINGIKMLKTLIKMESFNNMIILAVSGLSKADIDQEGGLPKELPLFTKPIPFDKIKNIVTLQYKALLKGDNYE